MIGNNIKRLRIENGMTQKALADKLFVSAQAVSRWENNDVEPSLGTITELSKIFGVSTDEILGLTTTQESVPPEPEIIVEKEYVYKEPPRQHLALCDKCHSPIYDKKDLCRAPYNNDKFLCTDCYNERIESDRKRELRSGKIRLVCSFIFGILAGLIPVISILTTDILEHISIGYAIFSCVGLFAFVSCCILNNNFVGEMALNIFSWGFVRMPGLIFSLDIDGCLWFITVKLLLALLGLALSVLCALLAIVVGCFVSIFVYPYALIKNIRHPEDTEF